MTEDQAVETIAAALVSVGAEPDDSQGGVPDEVWARVTGRIEGLRTDPSVELDYLVGTAKGTERADEAQWELDQAYYFLTYGEIPR